MLGQTRDAAMKQFTFIVQGVQNNDTKLQRLNTCYKNHFSLMNCVDKDLVEDYMEYLSKEKFFIEINVLYKSVIMFFCI